MKKLNKPFDYEHALNVTSNLNKLEFFLSLFYFRHTARNKEWGSNVNLYKEISKAGIDEIALYIYSPIPVHTLLIR